MSVFLAIDLDPAARALAVQVIEAHRAAHAAKWLREDKLHCTLVFLGNPTAAQVDAWRGPLEALAARHRPFSLSLEGAGAFATARAPSVLWLGVGGALDALRALQRDARQALGAADAPHAREYLPHVTLARAQGEAHFEALVAALQGLHGPPFRVEHLSLYESSHHTYRVLQQARFAP